MSEPNAGEDATNSGHLNDDDPLRKAALRSLKAKAQFKQYLLLWLGVSILLTVVWLLTSGGKTYFWPGWGIFGMGVAAFFIGIDAYGPRQRGFTEDRINAEIEKFRNKDSH